eukprot:1287810-Karenia_brevis.AAC.1
MFRLWRRFFQGPEGGGRNVSRQFEATGISMENALDMVTMWGINTSKWPHLWERMVNAQVFVKPIRYVQMLAVTCFW